MCGSAIPGSATYFSRSILASSSGEDCICATKDCARLFLCGVKRLHKQDQFNNQIYSMELTMKVINAYLIFNGNCREAMTFYQKCLGAEELQLVRFSDMPGDKHSDAKDRLAHARLVRGETVLMASDNL